jgi:hypothetical protein
MPATLPLSSRTWRIGEGEPGLLIKAAAVHQQRQILSVGRLTGHRSIDEGQYVGPDLCPDIVKARAQRRGMFGAQDPA